MAFAEGEKVRLLYCVMGVSFLAGCAPPCCAMRRHNKRGWESRIISICLSLFFVMWCSSITTLCAAHLGGGVPGMEGTALPPSPFLLEPLEIRPRYDRGLSANVTEVTLHVRLKRLTVPLLATEEGMDRSPSFAEPFPQKGSFSYTGRVYEVEEPEKSEDEVDTASKRLLHTFVPGPTLRVTPGGYIRMKLINDLEPMSPASEKMNPAGKRNPTAVASAHPITTQGPADPQNNTSDINKGKINSSVKHQDTASFSPMFFTMHHPNSTNVHFHGVHCDPHIDDPFISIVPQGSETGASEHDYLLPIPRDHAPGLHWYHAHSHGSVYFQVMGGLFGALVVEEAPQPFFRLQEEHTKKEEKKRGRDIRKNKKHPGEVVATAEHGVRSLGRPWLSSSVPSHVLVFHLYRLGNKKNTPESSCDGQTMTQLDEMVGNTVQPSRPMISGREDHNTTLREEDSTRGIRDSDDDVYDTQEPLEVSNLFLVNGQHRPTLYVQAKQPTLLRMLYAAGSCYLNLTFDPMTVRVQSNSSTGPCRLYPVGTDGVPLDLGHLPGHDDEACHAQGKRGPTMMVSPARPTTWLYFTPATRYEVILYCTRVPGEGVHPGSLPVVNQAGETIFFIKVEEPGPESRETGVSNAVWEGEMNSSKGWTRTPRTRGSGVQGATDSTTKSRNMGGAHKAADGDRIVDQVVETPADLRAARGLPMYLDLLQCGANGTDASPFLWELSFSQAPVLESSVFRQSPARPYYVLGEGPDCHSLLQNKNDAGGVSTENDDTNLTFISPLSLASPFPNCYYHPFEGPRGVNTSNYHGFVVPFNNLVEVHVFGDPTDLMPHPLHFHVNHFQFVSFTPRPGGLHTQYKDLSDFGIWPGQWRDTIPIFDGETVLRWRAATFSGEILYHCHMLSHEDRGMMTSYYIEPPPDVKGSGEPGKGGWWKKIIGRREWMPFSVTTQILLTGLAGLLFFLLSLLLCRRCSCCGGQISDAEERCRPTERRALKEPCSGERKNRGVASSLVNFHILPHQMGLGTSFSLLIPSFLGGDTPSYVGTSPFYYSTAINSISLLSELSQPSFSVVTFSFVYSDDLLCMNFMDTQNDRTGNYNKKSEIWRKGDAADRMNLGKLPLH
eukprot:gene1475-864_t